MNLYFRIVLILIGIAYIISPVDIIPDFMIPFLGFLDDGLVMAVIYYLIRYGTLPPFLLKRKKPFQRDKDRNSGSSEKKENSAGGMAKSPYDILGIRSGASREEITAAYKKAVKKYHPDKLSHLGEEFSSLANEKFLEIQRAYDALIKS